jgi:protein involved in polysaccharide export with SLBB domain
MPAGFFRRAAILNRKRKPRLEIGVRCAKHVGSGRMQGASMRHTMKIDRWRLALAAFCAVFFIALCGRVQVQAAPAAAPAAGSTSISYVLGTGDKLHINVFGQTDLNGDYVVDSNGNVQLPLIGEVHAAGRTVPDFQHEVSAKLADGYLVNPSVSVEVVNYRPFYIIGEVNKPGEYPYVNGMSVLNAVALAGGFTFRADDSEVYIRRNGAEKEVQYPADPTTKINPGDIVRVPERFF